MSKTKIRFAKCGDAARRQLQHLQRRFARGREARPTSEKYHTPEICGSNLRQDIEASADQFPCYLAQSLAQFSIFIWPFQHSDEARRQHQVVRDFEFLPHPFSGRLAKRSFDRKYAATSKAAGRSPAACGSIQAVFVALPAGQITLPRSLDSS